jgi:phospholipase/lecithinase/hemolysin
LNRGSCDEKINQAADGFNSGLNARIDGLKSSLPRLQIVALDYNKLVSDIIATLSKYGIFHSHN